MAGTITIDVMAGKLGVETVALEAVNGSGTWRAELSPGLIMLYDASGNQVLATADTDAAQHIRFLWDLRRGRVVHFSAVLGMKAFAFTCDKENLNKLVEWLPKKSPKQIQQEVMFQGLAMALAGAALLLWPESIHIVWGIGLAAIGMVMIVYRRRRTYIIGGSFMFAFGILQDFTSAAMVEQDGLTAFVPAFAAVALLCWSVHQLSMLTLNTQIQSARTLRAMVSSQMSRLVRRLGSYYLMVGVALGLIAGGLIVIASSADSTGGGISVSPATVVTTVLALVALVSGFALIARKRPAYRDAKACGQILIAGSAILLWTGPGHFILASWSDWLGPASEPPKGLIAAFYVIMLLLPTIIVFNRWFDGAVERELDEVA